MALQIKSLFSQISKNILNIFKGKRFFVIILLFFVTLGLIMPQTSLAVACGTDNKYLEFFCDLANPITGPLAMLTGEDPMTGFLAKGFIIAFGTIAITISSILSNWAAGILLWVMSTGINISYTGFDNPVVAAGWPIMRDLANMFVVLGFVIIGLATILRLKNYEAQKLLPRLIVVALLINFSLVICGFFIDASNIAIGTLFKGGGYLERSTLSQTGKDLSTIWSSNFFNKSPATFLAIVTGMVIKNYISLFIFIAYAFLFLLRYMMLWILVTFSPLAFVCAVFPMSQQLYKKWRDNFIQWCIIGMPAGFFLFVADKLTSRLWNTTTVSSVASASMVSNAAEIIIAIIPALFLGAGFLFSLQTSAMGAGIITSQAKKAWGASNAFFSKNAKAGAKLAGGKLANISGASGLYNRAGDSLTKLGERTGFIKMGAAAKRKAKQMEGYGTEIDSMESEDLGKSYKRNPRTEEDRKNNAKITEILSRRKKLKEIGNADEIATALENTDQYYGGDKAKNIRKEAEKASPILKTKNKDALVKAKARLPVGASQAEIEREVLREAHSEMGVSDMRNLDASQFNLSFIQDTNNKTFERAALEFSTDQKQKAKSLVNDIKTEIARILAITIPITDPGFIAAARSAYSLLPTGNPKRQMVYDLNEKLKIVD